MTPFKWLFDYTFGRTGINCSYRVRH